MCGPSTPNGSRAGTNTLKSLVFYRLLREISFQERRKTMPTFNQLVRKGREKVTYKSTSPAMQKGLNTLKNKETDLSALVSKSNAL